MFNLNPFENPDALWQHSVMIVVSAIIGYIIGHNYTKQAELKLRHKLAKVNLDLENCRFKNSSFYENKAESGSIFAGATIAKQDDLQVIEGIGPQIEILLNSEGINTFLQLSEVKAEMLVNILRSSGIKFHIHDPYTWPQQAQFASMNMWDQLNELKNELKKGRYQ